MRQTKKGPAMKLLFKPKKLMPVNSLIRQLISKTRLLLPSKEWPASKSHIRVLHIIPNFMLGGSSRLVVDLIENLGERYQHKVITSYCPRPPAYPGIDVTELRTPEPTNLLSLLEKLNPQLIHLHYWGDCDLPWYEIMLSAIKKLKCPVIQNINTPIEPYKADYISRYVYVSKYVQKKFGEEGPKHLTIYPGSDFNLFTKKQNQEN